MPHADHVADPRVDAIRGCVAIERGPLVYCIEAADNEGIDLAAVALDTDQPLPLTTIDGWPQRAGDQVWPAQSAPTPTTSTRSIGQPPAGR